MMRLCSRECLIRELSFCPSLTPRPFLPAKCVSCWIRGSRLTLRRRKEPPLPTAPLPDAEERFPVLSVRAKLLFTFGTLCAILLIIGGMFFFSLRSIERSNRLQQTRVLNKMSLIDETARDIGQMQAGVLRQVLASAKGEIKNRDQA